MYIVRGPKGNIHAICTRRIDAEAWLIGGPVDKKFYTIEEVKSNES